jgi:hypothetical protein
VSAEEGSALAEDITKNRRIPPPITPKSLNNPSLTISLFASLSLFHQFRKPSNYPRKKFIFRARTLTSRSGFSENPVSLEKIEFFGSTKNELHHKWGQNRKLRKSHLTYFQITTCDPTFRFFLEKEPSLLVT